MSKVLFHPKAYTGCSLFLENPSPSSLHVAMRMNWDGWVCKTGVERPLRCLLQQTRQVMRTTIAVIVHMGRVRGEGAQSDSQVSGLDD